MIPYSMPQEKETILHFADVLGDAVSKEIIGRDEVRTKEEAVHLAEFFWKMVEASNAEDSKSGHSSEYILEKIVITLMAYYRSAGYGDEWERVADEN
jgi:hypothetical protein